MALFLQYQADKKQAHSLKQSRINIGRDSTNDLVLTSERVSGFHCSIFVESGGVYIADLGSSNGTFINNEPLIGRKKIQAWDQLKLADIELVLADSENRSPTNKQPIITDAQINDQVEPDQRSIAPQPEVTPPKKRLGKLVLKSGDGPAEIDLFEENTFGRASDNSGVIGFDMVSGHHASLSVNKDKAIITDCNSTNGTQVNGLKVAEQQIYHGDEIAFDIVTYKVELPDHKKPKPELAKTGVRPIIEETPINNTTVRPAINLNTDENQKPNNSQLPEQKLEKVVTNQPLNNENPINNSDKDKNSFKPEIPQASAINDFEQTLTDKQTAINEDKEASVAKPNVSSIKALESEQSGLKWLLFSFEGRITRMQFWKAVISVTLVTIVINFGLAALFYPVNEVSIAVQLAGGLRFGQLHTMHVLLYGAIMLVGSWIMASIYSKRFHDRGKPTWLCSIIIVPYINNIVVVNEGSQHPFIWVNMLVMLWVFVELGCLKGKKEDNKYGLPPYK